MVIGDGNVGEFKFSFRFVCLCVDVEVLSRYTIKRHKVVQKIFAKIQKC